MQANNLFHGAGKESVGVGVAQIRFVCERQFGRVGKGFDVFRLEPDLIHSPSCQGNVVIGGLNYGLKTVELNAMQLVRAEKVCIAVGMDGAIAHEAPY
jgi:hypothetical protein